MAKAKQQAKKARKHEARAARQAAARRRRLTKAFAIVGVLALLVLGIATVFNGGSNSSNSTTTTSAGPTTTLFQPPGGKPTVTVPDTPPPTTLQSKDITVGTGQEAKTGDKVWVQYVGVSYSTKKQFDASWDRGQAFSFTLGNGEVIPGWDQGVAGMKVGGRRELTIPPSLGYGAQGQGDIKPNETLVFVVDLVGIG